MHLSKTDCLPALDQVFSTLPPQARVLNTACVFLKRAHAIDVHQPAHICSTRVTSGRAGYFNEGDTHRNAPSPSMASSRAAPPARLSEAFRVKMDTIDYLLGGSYTLPLLCDPGWPGATPRASLWVSWVCDFRGDRGHPRVMFYAI